jgi:methylglutaconyl-CoA hydratase
MSNKVLTELQNELFIITLNQPEKHNCYDNEVASLIAAAFESASKSSARLIVLKANGKHFCAGADLKWMKSASKLSAQENQKDMSAISEMFKTILKINIPIVGVVQGSVRGGGLGLVAACDIVCAHENANFSLSESKWGLIPGIITPLVMAKIGVSHFLELSLTSRVFDVNEAKRLQLIHKNENEFNSTISSLLANSSQANAQIKMLVKKYFFNQAMLDEMLQLSSSLRQSEEFQKRIKEF